MPGAVPVSWHGPADADADGVTDRDGDALAELCASG
jgi:hypothetical protein